MTTNDPLDSTVYNEVTADLTDSHTAITGGADVDPVADAVVGTAATGDPLDAVHYVADHGSFVRPGELPVRPPYFVGSTSLGKDMDILLRMTTRLGACTFISGPIGIGKTTAIAESARRINTEAVYVNMFGTTNYVQQLGLIWQSLSGTAPTGTAPQLQTQILDLLLRKDVLLLIDDSHRTHSTALQSILAVYDRTFCKRGKGTPIVLCGNQLEQHVGKTLPELLSRGSLKREFEPLAGRPLVELIMSMEPRIAGTDSAIIRDIDNHQFRGDLRRWRQFFEILELYREGDIAARPITANDVENVVSMMPRSTR